MARVDPENNSLLVTPVFVNEYGNKTSALGDTIFQGALIAISPEHHEIHCGDSYVTTRTVDLSNAAADNILIIVPDEPGTGQSQKLYHLNVIGDNESEAIWQLYEGTTVSANGTALGKFNRNRNSTNTSSLGIFHTPTVTDAGTLLETFHRGSGKAVGGNRRSEEIILKNNTTYLLRVTNLTSTANYVSWELNHYIHPGV